MSVAVNNSIRNLDLLHMTYAQKSLIDSGGYMEKDIFDVQKIMVSDNWKLEKIITHEFEIGQLEQAIQTASDVEHAGNVVIRFA